MADLVQTASSVQAVGSTVTSGTITQGTAGAAITAGQPVYLDSGNLIQLAQATTAVLSALLGVALNNAAVGQPVTVVQPVSFGPQPQLNLGATLVVGRQYAVSATSGKICPVADLVTGNYLQYVGVATTAALVQMNKLPAAILLP